MSHDDARDERLAALLEVPPLDEVTRRRLVRRALDEPGAAPGRGRRLLVAIAAAAAVLVVGVLGTSALLRDDSETNTTAKERMEKTDEPAAGAADEEVAAVPTFLGDLGEISDPAVLRERLAQLTAAPSPAAESVDFGCAITSELGIDGPFFLSASGTYQGTAVAVLVAPKDGINTAFVTDAACQLLAEVQLV